MKKQLLLIATLMCLLLIGCEHDNYDIPNAMLSGKVIYNGNAVGVRTNGIQLELYQDGYELFTKIPVHISQDGSYSVSIFNGQYKLVRMAGAPWEAQSKDTITIDVRGNTIVDVPVTPYFVVRSESFQKGTGTITAKFTVDKVVESAGVLSVALYLGKGVLTDNVKYEGIKELDLTGFALGSEMTISINIPEGLLKEDYLFARIGIRSTLSSEYYFTQAQKISLK